MKPVQTFSPLVHRGVLALGAVLLLGLLWIAWATDTNEVGLELEFKLQLTAAALVLGGGAMVWARRYKQRAVAEAELADTVRRNLGLE